MRKIVEITKKPDDPNLRELLERISRGEDRIRVGGLEGSTRAFLLALLFYHLRRTLIVIVPEEKEAGTCFRDLTFFLDDGEAFLLPSWDLLTIDMFAFQRETELARLEVFHRLLYGAAGSPTLMRLIETLWLKAGPVSNQLFDAPEAVPRLNDAHEDALEALRRGDGTSVRAAIERDLFVAGQTLRRRCRAG